MADDDDDDDDDECVLDDEPADLEFAWCALDDAAFFGRRDGVRGTPDCYTSAYVQHTHTYTCAYIHTCMHMYMHIPTIGRATWMHAAAATRMTTTACYTQTTIRCTNT